MDTLPLEVLLRILNYLDMMNYTRVSTVSRLWYTHIFCCTGLDRTDFSLCTKCDHPRVTNVCRFKQNELAFSKIVRTCDRLTFLDLSGFSHFYKVDRRGNLNFELPFPKMTKLTTLNLSGASIGPLELAPLLSTTPNLTSLNLSNIRELNSQSIVLLTSLKSLTDLDLSSSGLSVGNTRWFEIKSNSISTLLSHCTNITSLKLKNQQINLEVMESLAKFTSLKLLDIESPTVMIRGECWKEMCSKNLDLETLIIDNPEQLAGSDFGEHLSNLIFFQSKRFQLFQWNVFSKTCKKLKTLKIANFPSLNISVINDIPSCFSELEHLSLESLQVLSEGAIIGLSTLTNLQSLTLTTQMNHNFKNDNTIKRLCEQCTNLSELNLGQTNLTPKGLIEISSLKYLTKFELSRFGTFENTEEGLISIAEKCHVLEEVKLNYFPFDTAKQEMIKANFLLHCPWLKTIQITTTSFFIK